MAATTDVAPVAVARSETIPIVREERVTGTVTSPRTSSLSTQVGGMVAALPVDAGDRVAAGGLLVELDHELADLKLELFDAAARRARAELADARRRLRERRALERDQTISASELEARATAVAVAEAEMAGAAAEVRHQRAVVARHRITAPYDGVISRRVAEVGEWVSPGDTVVELVATTGLRFDFRAPQELYPRLNEDTAVEVFLDALPGRPIAGRIHAAVPVSDPSARTFLLRVLPAEDAHPTMTPGMSVRGILRLETGRRGVVVPRDALLRYPDGRVSVWVVERSATTPRAREHQIRLGLAFGDEVEIRDGLASGATVVVEGNEALRDGQAVRVRGGD
ncbi:MAG: efflux RND transporter periplasmic adaptor subunit [Gammaproteobacteria bacterium]|nr:efflux RND transporter periplasmic adaptor subunit [Gammaproteobacteria bacterium]